MAAKWKWRIITLISAILKLLVIPLFPQIALQYFLKKRRKKKFYYPEDWTGSVKMIAPERYHYTTEDWSSGDILYNLYSLLSVVRLQPCFDYFFMNIFLYITSISYSHLLLFDLVIYDVIISGNTWKKDSIY